MLCSQDRLKWLRKKDEVGRPIEVLYGSPHGSAPKLTRYGIGPGDVVFVVTLVGGVVSVLTRLRVGQIVGVTDYLRTLGVSDELLALHLWKLVDRLARERPELGHRLPFGCVDEVALAAEGATFRLDRPVPGDVLAALRIQPKRGPAHGLPVADGKLTKTVAIQGHFYRLVEAAALDALVDAAP